MSYKLENHKEKVFWKTSNFKL